MKIVLVPIFLSLTSAVAFAGPVDLRDELRYQLRNEPEINSRRVGAEVGERGVVHLSGEVPSLETKRRIEEIVGSVEGVSVIENDIIVAPEPAVHDLSYTTPRPKEILDRIVRTDPPLTNYHIDVAVYGDTVRLDGYVESEEEKVRAESIAATMPGVSSVVNNLTVGYEVDDSLLQTKVREALSQDGDIDVSNLDITAQDGVVTFKGMQPNHRAVDSILSRALMVRGVKDVQTEMTVRGRPYPRFFDRPPRVVPPDPAVRARMEEPAAEVETERPAEAEREALIEAPPAEPAPEVAPDEQPRGTSLKDYLGKLEAKDQRN